MLIAALIRSRDAAAYIVFQLVGGVLAALLVMLLFHDAGAAVHYGATAVNAKVVANGSPWLGGLVIGGALGLAVMVFGPATGAGLNPARWLGPALASGSYPDFWIFIVGPVAGAACEH